MSLSRLTPEQIAFYHENGYIKDLPPIYDDAGVADLNTGIKEIV